MKPCKFVFEDSPAFDGFALGSTWNGFDNVSVTPTVRDQIVAYFKKQAEKCGHEYEDDLHEIAIGDDGLVCLGWGSATQIVETRDELCAEYQQWCEQQKLPAMSADELIFEKITDAQRAYVSAFVRRWEAMEKREEIES